MSNQQYSLDTKSAGLATKPSSALWGSGKGLGMLFGSHLGLGAVAAPYTQKALEERLEMIRTLQHFLALVFSMASDILTKMQAVEQQFYTQASDMIRQDAYGQLAGGLIGLGSAGVGIVGGEIMNGRSGTQLNQEADILDSYSVKLKSTYSPTKTEAISDPLGAEKDIDSSSATETVTVPVLKTSLGEAKAAGEEILGKSELDSTQKSVAKRTELRAMKKNEREQLFEKLNKNSSEKTGKAKAIRTKYAEKFAEKAKLLRQQGSERTQKANALMQMAGGMAQVSGLATGGFNLRKADIQKEQADSAAAKQANSMIDGQYSKLGNDSIDQLQAFVKSLDAQVSIDSQINQQRG